MIRTVFRERSSRKPVSYEEQIISKDKYKIIFSCKLGAIMFIIPQIVAKRLNKCLRTAYCLLRGMFSFEYSLVRLYERKKYFPSSVNVTTIKRSVILN